MAQPARRPEEERPRAERRPPLREVEPTEEERGERAGQEQRPTSGMAIGGLALSVIGLLLPAIFALIAGAAGAVLGWSGLNQIRRGERSGSWVAWAAIILGAIVVVLAVVAIIVGIT